MILRPVVRPLVRPVMGPIGSRVGSNGAFGFTALRALIAADERDVNHLFITDSTGNASDEWPYLFSQWLGTECPTHTVSYRLWDDVELDYGAATILSEGTGEHTIHIWNAAVPGSSANHFCGSKQAAAIEATNADSICLAHGHNLLLSNPILCRSELMMGIEAARLVFPQASVTLLLQNPNRDDDNMNTAFAAVREIAADYGDVDLIDGATPFFQRGKDGSLYIDNIHVGPLGSPLIASAAVQRFTTSRIARASKGASLAHTGTNRILNADFLNPAAYTGGTPTNWSLGGGATCELETVVVPDGATQCLKITGTAANGRISRQVGSADRAVLAGNWATIAVLGHVAEGSASSVGRIGISYTSTASGTGNFTSRATASTQGRFKWTMLSVLIPADVLTITVTLNNDTAANTDSAARYAKAVLEQGRMPLDAA